MATQQESLKGHQKLREAILGFERGTREIRGSPTSRITSAHPALTLHSPSLRMVAGKNGVAWVSEK